jgi:glycosyltransferase involved in cell wall biosynthesis
VLSDKNIGGAGKCVLALVDWSNGTKFRGSIEVVLPRESDLTPEFLKRDVFVTEIDHLDSSFDSKAIKILHGIMKQKQPDIIHTHAALSARVAARKYKKAKIVYTRHSYYDQKTKLLNKIPNWMINNAMADAIIAVSPAVADNLKSLGAPKKKIHIIFNGVPYAPVFQPDKRLIIREEYGLKPNHFIVSIMARLVKDKDHDTLLDAAKMLCDIDRSIKFIIAGKGEEEHRLKVRVQHEDIRNVLFTGFVNEIEKIENITDLQVNTSIGTEATSLALLDGLSLGIPAVASDFGGNPYVIVHGRNGLLFPKRRPIALVNAILEIRNNRDLYNDMSFQALEVFETRFTLDRMGSQTFALYEKLLRGPKHAR